MFQKILLSYSAFMTINIFLNNVKDAINMYLRIKKESNNTRRNPYNWCGMDRPLEDFAPLLQWKYLRFNLQYELVEILNDFETNATVFDTLGVRFSKLTRIGNSFFGILSQFEKC